MKYDAVAEFLRKPYPDQIDDKTKEFRERNMIHYKELLF